MNISGILSVKILLILCLLGDMSLKELLLQEDDDLDFTRFGLLAWQITGNRNGIPEIASFPKRYFVSCLALYYLVKVSPVFFFLFL